MGIDTHHNKRDYFSNISSDIEQHILTIILVCLCEYLTHRDKLEHVYACAS
jgi:hypothetical protein